MDQAGLRWTSFQEDKIAEAVVDAYPDRAVNTWEKLAESQIAQTQPKTYEVAAGFLRNMRRTFKKLGRDSEWLSTWHNSGRLTPARKSSWRFWTA